MVSDLVGFDPAQPLLFVLLRKLPPLFPIHKIISAWYQGREYWFQPLPKTADLAYSVLVYSYSFAYTVEPRYLELAYFELPPISKWKSGPCFNMKLWQQIQNNVEKRGAISPLFHIILYIYF